MQPLLEAGASASQDPDRFLIAFPFFAAVAIVVVSTAAQTLVTWKLTKEIQDLFDEEKAENDEAYRAANSPPIPVAPVYQPGLAPNALAQEIGKYMEATSAVGVCLSFVVALIGPVTNAHSTRVLYLLVGTFVLGLGWFLFALMTPAATYDKYMRPRVPFGMLPFIPGGWPVSALAQGASYSAAGVVAWILA